MSGELPILSLVADPTGTVERLVRALDKIDEAHIGEWCLIGGMAVMCRLAEAHRVTQDLDTLVRSERGEGAAELLLKVAAARTSTGSAVLADGTKVDVIEVTTELDEEALPADVLPRMFVLSHFFIAEGAEPVELELRDGDLALLISRTLRLARPAGLVGAKLQAIETRSAASAAKRHTDALDIYRLLRTGPETMAAELMLAPGDLAQWCAGQIERLFVEEAPRTKRWLARAAGPAFSPASFEDLEGLGQTAVATLRTRK